VGGWYSSSGSGSSRAVGQQQGSSRAAAGQQQGSYLVLKG